MTSSTHAYNRLGFDSDSDSIEIISARPQHANIQIPDVTSQADDSFVPAAPSTADSPLINSVSTSNNPNLTSSTSAVNTSTVTPVFNISNATNELDTLEDEFNFDYQFEDDIFSNEFPFSSFEPEWQQSTDTRKRKFGQVDLYPTEDDQSYRLRTPQAKPPAQDSQKSKK